MTPPEHALVHRPPYTVQKDAYFAHGVLLRAAVDAPEQLSRMLAVTNLGLHLLCDALRPGSAELGQTQDTPVSLLGSHYVSHRELADYSDGSSDRLQLQELCTFDALEGPKNIRRVAQQGASAVASLHWWCDPQVRCKHNRITGRSYVKVTLEGGAKVQLVFPSSAPDTRGCSITEDYTLTLPALVIDNPLTGRCPVEWKGELVVQCEGSGLVSTISIKAGADVKGSLDSWVPDSTQKSRLTRIGVYAGNWRSSVSVSCPSLGLEGVVHSCTSPAPTVPTSSGGTSPVAAPLPPPMRYIALQQLGPMRLPRLWSALHDALMYADPKAAVGGKAAEDVAAGLASSLSGLFFEPLSSRDVQPVGDKEGAGAAAAGPQKQAAAKASGGEDSSEDEQPPARQPDTAAADDDRTLPPCFKAQHAAGHRLRYQLHAVLLHCPIGLLRAGNSTV